MESVWVILKLLINNSFMKNFRLVEIIRIKSELTGLIHLTVVVDHPRLPKEKAIVMVVLDGLGKAKHGAKEI